MSEQGTERFEMHLTPGQKVKIERLAEQKGSTLTAAVLEAIDRALESERSAVEAQPGSVLELTEDLCGSVEGPRDLSTHPKHMNSYGDD